MTNIQAIEFNGSKILTTKQNDKIYFGVKSICENIGVDYSSQYRNINRDEVLSSAIAVIATPSNSGKQDTCFLPLDYLNGFLFGISVERLKNEKARELLIKYKKECYQVLADYFLGNSPSQPLNKSTPNLKEQMEEAIINLQITAIKFINKTARRIDELTYTTGGNVKSNIEIVNNCMAVMENVRRLIA